MPQAKCEHCQKCYLWPSARHLVRDARCPKCFRPLKPTSQNVKLATIEIDKPVYLGVNFMRGARRG